MIPAGVEIYVALEPVDMRLSFDRLAGLAKEQVGYDARSGALFIFFGRRGHEQESAIARIIDLTRITKRVSEGKAPPMDSKVESARGQHEKAG